VLAETAQRPVAAAALIFAANLRHRTSCMTSLRCVHANPGPMMVRNLVPLIPLPAGCTAARTPASGCASWP